MLREIDTLRKNKTYELVERPSNVHIIKSIWIYRIKTWNSIVT
jgi:hypothetical protein